MSSQNWRPEPFPSQVQTDSTSEGDGGWCRYCGEVIEVDDRCFYVLRGVMKIGEKSGRAYVEEDTYDKEEAVILHELCALSYFREQDGLGEEDELIKFCAGCGTKLHGE